MRRGFTLVELSIVLVIVGLLIGGVLVARSMISTAQLQTFVRQVQQVDIAVNNFKSKYRTLPGDSTFFSPPGNGNGSLDDGNCTDDSVSVDIVQTESAAFLAHLQDSDAGFMNKYEIVAIGSAESDFGNTGNTFSAVLPRIATIPISYGKGGSLVGMTAGCSSQTNPFNNGDPLDPTVSHYLIEDFASGIGTNGGSDVIDDVGNPVFTPAEALAYDKKADDGLPLAGAVKGTNAWNCISSNQYDVTQAQPQCDLSVKMLSQVGIVR